MERHPTMRYFPSILCAAVCLCGFSRHAGGCAGRSRDGRGDQRLPGPVASRRRHRGRSGVLRRDGFDCGVPRHGPRRAVVEAGVPRMGQAAVRAAAPPGTSRRSTATSPSRRAPIWPGSTRRSSGSTQRLNTWMGTWRGTGVVRRTAAGWRVLQYNLTMELPNDRLGDVVHLLRVSRAVDPADETGDHGCGARVSCRRAGPRTRARGW